MRSTAKNFSGLKKYVDSLPIVDCHDHSHKRIKVDDAIQYLLTGYFRADIVSASSEKDVEMMEDRSLPFDERWAIFEKAYRRAEFTGYGLHVKMAVKKTFGIDEITIETARKMQENMPDFTDPKVYDKYYEDAGIVARIANIFQVPPKEIFNKTHELLPGQRLVIQLPEYHRIKTRADVEVFEKVTGATVTSLDEYMDLCRTIFDAYRDFGAVALKDQSTYGRRNKYSTPAKADAEALFNRIIEDPRHFIEYKTDGNPLSDYLMHEFMRVARDMDLPVQVHTGHMSGTWNDVEKTNAAGLRSLFEIHREVRFDLFHANWPYSGDLLYLVKNYPNVCMDFCWTHIVDPYYSKEMLKQAVSSVPHGKIHGFGSDVGGNQPDKAWAHCMIAKETIAAALAELVDIDYINNREAEKIATDWLFDNPNDFFRLGLER